MANNTKTKRFITPEQTEQEQPFESSLRPKRLDDFVGQQTVKNNLSIAITAAQQRQEPLEHVLLYGNPGLGKTTLAHIIARELDSHIKITSGPALERVGDLAAILSNLQDGDVLFIDEIHRMNRTIEETLYPAMEDYVLDIVLGKGPAARVMRMNLARFTIIGATTRMSLLSSPLRDRFGMVFALEFYNHDELQTIVNTNAQYLNTAIHSDASQMIATRCRKTPRIANRLLKRIRDFSQVKGNDTITAEIAKQALAMLDVDHLGLDRTDRTILHTLIEKFRGGPVGLNTLAASTAEEIDTMEMVYEPYLLQLGMIERTPRGRVATRAAYTHLDLLHLMSDPKNQDKLL